MPATTTRAQLSVTLGGSVEVGEEATRLAAHRLRVVVALHLEQRPEHLSPYVTSLAEVQQRAHAN